MGASHGVIQLAISLGARGPVSRPSLQAGQIPGGPPLCPPGVGSQEAGCELLLKPPFSGVRPGALRPAVPGGPRTGSKPSFFRWSAEGLSPSFSELEKGSGAPLFLNRLAANAALLGAPPSPLVDPELWVEGGGPNENACCFSTATHPSVKSFPKFCTWPDCPVNLKPL